MGKSPFLLSKGFVIPEIKNRWLESKYTSFLEKRRQAEKEKRCEGSNRFFDK